jgi:lysophospholipase L1-like esterase
MSFRKTCTFVALAALAAVGLIAPSVATADVLVQNGQKVAFLGDSITAQGWGKPAGYVNLVVKGLAANGVTVTPIPAGVGGDTSKQMLVRLQRDVISRKPDWMTLSCGVNDVWHGANGVDLDTYKTNITSIVDQCQAANIKVIILTATPITENMKADNNVKLAAYNAFLKDLATQKSCPFADLNSDFAAVYAKKTTAANAYTVDGVHMNPAGDFIMASGILRAMGLSDAALDQVKEKWMDIPGGVPVQITIPVTPRQWFALNDASTAAKKDVPTYLQGKAIDALQASMPTK